MRWARSLDFFGHHRDLNWVHYMLNHRVVSSQDCFYRNFWRDNTPAQSSRTRTFLWLIANCLWCHLNNFFLTCLLFLRFLFLLSRSRHVFTNFPSTNLRIFSQLKLLIQKRHFFSVLSIWENQNKYLVEKIVDLYSENSWKHVVSLTFENQRQHFDGGTMLEPVVIPLYVPSSN